jgi:hypothetical protein
MSRSFKSFAAAAGLTVVAASMGVMGGCNNAGQGLLAGGGLGAAAGAIIGSLSGNAGTGAAIGAVAGGLGGAVIGDQNERRQYEGSYQGGPYYGAPVYGGAYYAPAYPATTYTYREYYRVPDNYYECAPRRNVYSRGW